LGANLCIGADSHEFFISNGESLLNTEIKSTVMTFPLKKNGIRRAGNSLLSECADRAKEKLCSDCESKTHRKPSKVNAEFHSRNQRPT
jgi:hypothetical protein